MTTELVLLIALFAFLVSGSYFSDKGPSKTFFKAAPMLGARIEKEITTGRGFKKNGGPTNWKNPPGPPPGGDL